MVKWQSHQPALDWSLLFESGSGRIILYIYLYYSRDMTPRKEMMGPVGEVAITPSKNSLESPVRFIYLYHSMDTTPETVIRTCW
jgi:hypothetical protein